MSNAGSLQEKEKGEKELVQLAAFEKGPQVLKPTDPQSLKGNP